MQKFLIAFLSINVYPKEPNVIVNNELVNQYLVNNTK